MQLNSITTERLEQIERERNETLGNPEYHQWVRELNVSASYSEPTGILNARHMMSLWDPDRYEQKGVIHAIAQTLNRI